MISLDILRHLLANIFENRSNSPTFQTTFYISKIKKPIIGFKAGGTGIPVIKKLKEKDFPEVRKWVVNNLDNDTSVLLRRIYDACYDSMVPNSIPAAVLTLAKYQYQMAFVADQEINMLACLTEIMVECEFK